MRKKLLHICVISLFFTMCEEQSEEKNNVGFSALNGNSFTLTVDRIATMPKVQFPKDRLHETDYARTSEDILYVISFSENGDRITIEPGAISGKRMYDDEGSKFYDLKEGLFAGGHFILWINNHHFEAEYTIYGSGIPIIRSERGKLEL